MNDDDDLLRTLLTTHLPDPPPQARPPAGARLRRQARGRTLTMAAAALGVVLVTVAASTAALNRPAPAPADPFAGLYLVPWTWGSVSADGRTISVPISTGACEGPWELRADERPDRVLVGLVDRSGGTPMTGPCLAILYHRTLEVDLPEPLAGRPVIDATDNQPKRIIDLSEVLSPGYPPASELEEGSVSMQPVEPDGQGLVWRHELVWKGLALTIDQFEAAMPGGRLTAAPLRQVTVRGHVGDVYADAVRGQDGRWLSHSVTLYWTEGDWRLRVGLNGLQAADVEERLSIVRQVAESLH
jgi:hypothetical protein